MKALLLDTHIWFWYLTGSRRLPGRIKEILDRPDELPWLSPVSIWEIAILLAKKRIEISTDFRSWHDEALRMYPIREAPMNFEVALQSREIELAHRDPADHFIAATALVYDLTLVTVDRRLKGHRWLPTFSG